MADVTQNTSLLNLGNTNLPAAQSSDTMGGVFTDAINAAAKKYNLLPQILTAQINQESGFNPNAIGTSGEIGLMQLKPSTAADLGTYNLFDPYQNIDAGAKYLSQQLAANNNNYFDALRAYNAGPTGAANDITAGATYARQILDAANKDVPITSSESQASAAAASTIDSVSASIKSVGDSINNMPSKIQASFTDWFNKWGISAIVGILAVIVLLLGFFRLSGANK